MWRANLDNNMQRMEQLSTWLDGLYPGAVGAIVPASEDAGFRRYFRVPINEASRIVMDAPPDREDCQPFLHVAGLFRAAGVHVPEVYAQDLAQGFLLLSDLGPTTYLDALSADNADQLYQDAIDTLIRVQLASREGVLPDYSRELLTREVRLFPDWYLARHCAAVLTPELGADMERVFERVVEHNLRQPRVFVHRDYMPRNLMVSEPNPGVLDFQDAVYGPITYDVLSLLKDAFLSWEEERVLDWVIRYWEKARRASLPVNTDFAAFYRDFEWMGVQRHLKVLGIFARLNYRDGKPRYLADTPRFVAYVRQVAVRYKELAPLLRVFDALEGKAQSVGYTF
jgi:aminoglycoside/choline kinase family phosphotransferase